VRRPTREEGSAVIEMVGLSVLLILPVVYLVLSVVRVQAASFAATQAAREAGRAFATASDSAAGLRRADAAVALALRDQHVDPRSARTTWVPGSAGCSAPGVQPRLEPGSQWRVCLVVHVDLPFADAGPFARSHPLALTLRSQYLLDIDDYRSTP